MLITIVLCTNDQTLINDSIAAVKEVSGEQFTPQIETFMKNLQKQRKDPIKAPESNGVSAQEQAQITAAGAAGGLISGLARTVTSVGKTAL